MPSVVPIAVHGASANGVQYQIQFSVQSSSHADRYYTISLTQAGEWQCSCRGWTMHVPRRDCRHIQEVLRTDWQRSLSSLGYTARVMRRTELEQAEPVGRPGVLPQIDAVGVDEVVRLVTNIFSDRRPHTIYICNDCEWIGQNPQAAQHEADTHHSSWTNCQSLESALTALNSLRGQDGIRQRVHVPTPPDFPPQGTYRWLSSDGHTIYTIMVQADGRWWCSTHGATDCGHINKVKNQIRSSLQTFPPEYVRTHPNLEWTRCACGWYGPTLHASPHYAQHRLLGQSGTHDDAIVLRWNAQAVEVMAAEVEAQRRAEEEQRARELQGELGILQTRQSCRHDPRARAFVDAETERCGVCQVLLPMRRAA